MRAEQDVVTAPESFRLTAGSRDPVRRQASNEAAPHASPAVQRSDHELGSPARGLTDGLDERLAE